MASEIHITYSDPTAGQGTEPEFYYFTVFNNVFPNIAVTVERQAIEDFARARGVETLLVKPDDYLDELRRFQPDFVHFAFNECGGRTEVTITAADVAKMLS